ncbi:hypothetical protein AMECASPLE_027412 [Ameca splendens]|uniref:Uncharacterized protein n=1 Tax=Ameca splendens TaxID=208324 RepID=A0ABV0ZEE5_9TELE
MLGDKSFDFYRDPVIFWQQRIEKHHSRVFQCDLQTYCFYLLCVCVSGEVAYLLRLSLNNLFSGTCLQLTTSRVYVNAAQPLTQPTVYKQQDIPHGLASSHSSQWDSASSWS